MLFLQHILRVIGTIKHFFPLSFQTTRGEIPKLKGLQGIVSELRKHDGYVDDNWQPKQPHCQEEDGTD